MTDKTDMPEGITRDDTVHGETYFTASDMATASAQGFRDGVASLAASAGSEPVAAPPMDGEIALIEKAVQRAGITSLLNHGAASCVFTEGCAGVSQEHLLAYTREIALHCAVALGTPSSPEGMVGGWITLPSALPEPGTPVLLDIGKKYPIRAMWAAKHTVEAHDEADPEWTDYDDAGDAFYCPEGWYEWNENEEVHWSVNAAPRSWMPLPAPPASEAKEAT